MSLFIVSSPLLSQFSVFNCHKRGKTLKEFRVAVRSVCFYDALPDTSRPEYDSTNQANVKVLFCNRSLMTSDFRTFL